MTRNVDTFHLFPILTFQSAFTTNDLLADALPGVVYVPIDEERALGVHRVAAQTTHPLVRPPSPFEESQTPCSVSCSSPLPPPNLAWEAFYPKGSINPRAAIPGGFSFYLSGPTGFSERVETAREVVFSYRFMMQQGWDWVKGGKLPGVFGGKGGLAYSCSGGRQTDRDHCFNMRIMWREQGVSELYAYLPITPTNHTRLLAVPPFSSAQGDYGYSIGRGSFSSSLAVGCWMSVAIRTKLNTIGSEDGEVEVWINGKSVIDVGGLVLRTTDEASIRGLHCQTFFGGHTDDWASSKDQKAWFADVSGAIIS